MCGYKTFLKLQNHEKDSVEKKQVWRLMESGTNITQFHAHRLAQFSATVCLQILSHLRKVKSCLEEEMCIASGEKTKKDEVAANRKRPRQERERENEEKKGIRDEKKKLEKRIEQLEKRVEDLDNNTNHPGDRLG